MAEPQTTACKPGVPEASGSLDRLVRLCVANHTLEELALGWLRYECVRKLNARAFAELCKRNISGENFDRMVTSAIEDWKLCAPSTFAPTPGSAPGSTNKENQ
jgi:hypothetical protein